MSFYTIFAEMIGYTPEEIIGRPIIDFIIEEEIPHHLKQIENRRRGMGGQYERRFRHKNGREVCTFASASPLIDEQRHFEGSFAMFTDITERKQTENALRESEKRLSEIINFLPDATFAVDRDGRIIAWNRALEEMTGFKSEDMLGKGDHEYAIPFYGIRRPILIDLAFKSDEETEKKYDYFRREGDFLVAEASLILRNRPRVVWGKIATLLDSNGNVSGAIETLRDVTDQKRGEKEQEKLREQLFQSQKMETVGLLAGGIAHDFNNLLTPVIGYSESMAMELPEGDQKREKLERVLDAAELMKGLTAQLLAFSRKQMLELKEVDLGSIIRENIEIRISLEPSLDHVNADMDQIKQVLLNLAVNAQDAMPNGGILTIEARNTDLDELYTATHPEVVPGSYVMFSVSDTGTGMDKELYDLLSRGRPKMKVLYISGYTGDVIGRHGILDEGVNFLQKPFTITSLSQKIKAVLIP